MAGSIAAGVTTPVDVAKTRIMLSGDTAATAVAGTWRVLKEVHRSGGVSALFSGFTPRVTWIGIGGFVYFEAYEYSKEVIQRQWPKSSQ